MERPPEFFRRPFSFAVNGEPRPSKQADRRRILFVGLGDLLGIEASKISELEADCGRGSGVAVRGGVDVFCFVEGAEGARLPNGRCIDDGLERDRRYF